MEDGSAASGAGIAIEAAPRDSFSCNVCHRSYSRIDHLARHFRSHTQERPFVCQPCGKSFARGDLLKRHSTIHADAVESPVKRRRQDEAPTSNNAGGTRQRAAKACIACAEAKIRCEGAHPCLRCERRSIECKYLMPRAEAGPATQSSTSTAAPDPSLQLSSSQLVGDTNTRHATFDHSADTIIGERSASPVLLTSVSDPAHARVGNDGISRSHDTADFETMASLPLLPTFGQEQNGTHTHTEDLSLIDLLRDTRNSADRAFAGDSQHFNDFWPADVLDFGMDLPSLPDYTDVDARFLDEFSAGSLQFPHDGENPGGVRSGTATPSGIARAGLRAFQKSVWLWNPERADRAGAEEVNLALSDYGTTAERLDCLKCQSSQGEMSHAVRGNVLAMVLRTCEVAMYPVVVVNFPGSELLNHLVHNFLNFHARQDVTWIHTASLDLNKADPTFLAAMAAYGATLSAAPEARKLGYALQEAVRNTVSSEFERDNSRTRDLRPLQTFALWLDIGLWSGDRRKMEIAESFAMPLITMVRRGEHFRRSDSAKFWPQKQDIGDVLESKWRSWIERESYKRLALYLFFRDVRSSMSLLSQPLISYAEVTTNLPGSRKLWLASTATDWKTKYFLQQGDDAEIDCQLSLHGCIKDSSALFNNAKFIDVTMALLVLLATSWALVWHSQEMRTISTSDHPHQSRARGFGNNIQHHEVEQTLQHIKLNALEWSGSIEPAVRLLHEQCLMHLHVSLVDVQLLAGKRGESEARRVLPSLTRWVESADAREAIFHAGQIIRAAKELDDSALREASAVTIYHASVVCWAYAMLSKCKPDALDATGNSMPRKYVRLDADPGPDVQRFLVIGKGIPCIGRHKERSDAELVQHVPLDEPVEVMNTITSILHKISPTGIRNTPSLVENLTNLMQALGKAALVG